MNESEILEAVRILSAAMSERNTAASEYLRLRDAAADAGVRSEKADERVHELQRNLMWIISKQGIEVPPGATIEIEGSVVRNIGEQAVYFGLRE